MIEFIRWWTVHYPSWVQAWAVLVIIDMTLLVLVPLMPEDEEDGIESASAVGVIDQLTEEVSRGP